MVRPASLLLQPALTIGAWMRLRREEGGIPEMHPGDSARASYPITVEGDLRCEGQC